MRKEKPKRTKMLDKVVADGLLSAGVLEESLEKLAGALCAFPASFALRRHVDEAEEAETIWSFRLRVAAHVITQAISEGGARLEDTHERGFLRISADSIQGIVDQCASCEEKRRVMAVLVFGWLSAALLTRPVKVALWETFFLTAKRIKGQQSKIDGRATRGSEAAEEAEHEMLEVLHEVLKEEAARRRAAGWLDLESPPTKKAVAMAIAERTKPPEPERKPELGHWSEKVVYRRLSARKIMEVWESIIKPRGKI